jgi:L-threonylcarbamoyladenylate synthase
VLKKIDLENPDESVLDLAVRVIQSGGLVLSPTDTVYGLACSPFYQDSLECLLALKGRSSSKGLLLLLPDQSWIQRLASGISKKLDGLLSELWPGPYTILVKGHSSLSPILLGNGGKIGCRVPDSGFLNAWLDRLDSPLVSTSANMSGEQIPGSIEELEELFLQRVDLFLDGGEPWPGKPSTVIDCSSEPFRIVRSGAGLEQLQQCLRR